MAMDVGTERRLLQICVAIAACVPVGTGLAGAALGQQFLTTGPIDISLDSHFRYLSGLLLAVGLLYWSVIPQIEKHTLLFSRLTVIVVAGGLARLYGVLVAGPPPAPMLFGLGMELIVAPALWLWHWRLARRWAEVMEGLK
jgi:Domain of unknown function (DUF4345)